MKSLLLLLILLYLPNSFCQTKIVYHLTKNKIDLVSPIYILDSTYNITVKLKPKYIKEFYLLTKNNIGKLLLIEKNKTVLIRAIIKAAIHGGRMSIETTDEKEAKKYLDILQK